MCDASVGKSRAEGVRAVVNWTQDIPFHAHASPNSRVSIYIASCWRAVARCGSVWRLANFWKRLIGPPPPLPSVTAQPHTIVLSPSTRCDCAMNLADGRSRILGRVF
jgi:hypothetical protein